MANIAMGHSLNCSILVHNEETPTDDEWDRWVAFASAGGASATNLTRVLVFSAGGSPTPKQRAKIHTLMPTGGSGLLTAVVIGSRVARTVVGAMALFNPGVRAFAPNRVSDAFDYLRISNARWPEVLDLVRQLHDEIGVPFTASLE